MRPATVKTTAGRTSAGPDFSPSRTWGQPTSSSAPLTPTSSPAYRLSRRSNPACGRCCSVRPGCRSGRRRPCATSCRCTWVMPWTPADGRSCPRCFSPKETTRRSTTRAWVSWGRTATKMLRRGPKGACKRWVLMSFYLRCFCTFTRGRILASRNAVCVFLDS